MSRFNNGQAVSHTSSAYGRGADADSGQGSAFQSMMSATPSAPTSPSFTHAPLIAMPGATRKTIAGPANMPEVEHVGSSDEEGLGKGVGKGWLGDLDG